jgi:S1-C subfamily serine protease
MWRVVIGLMWVCFALNSHAIDHQKTKQWKTYLGKKNHKAFFWSAEGKFGYAYGHKSIPEAIQAAKKFCIDAGGINCQIKDISRNNLIAKFPFYGEQKTNKAIALSLKNATWGMSYNSPSVAAAQKASLDKCTELGGIDCLVIVVNNQVSDLSSSGYQAPQKKKVQTSISKPTEKGPALVGTGSGFFVSSQHFVTNHHVVDGCKKILLARNGRAIGMGVPRYLDATNDLALLDAPVGSKSWAKINVTNLEKGEEVWAFGYPLGGLLSQESKITDGIVSSVIGKSNDNRLMQITNAIQPGNSGGPLLNSRASVIGVNTLTLNTVKTAALMGGALPQSLNFSIKVKIVEMMLLSQGVAPTYSVRMDGSDLRGVAIAKAAEKFTAQVLCYN